MSIDARSEAYGYALGCRIAKALSEFCRTRFDANEKSHLVIIEKHIQVLSIVYHGRLRGNGGDRGKQLVNDLGLLVQKYTTG